MATVKQYALRLFKTQKSVAQQLGTDITWGGADARVAALTNDVMLAALIKILVDAGVITDAQLTAAYGAVTSAVFPPQPAVIQSPMDGTPVPDPDLGA